MKRFALILFITLFSGILITSCGSGKTTRDYENNLMDSIAASNGENVMYNNGSENDIFTHEESKPESAIPSTQEKDWQNLWFDSMFNGTSFLGSSLRNPDEFTLTYEIFNSTEEWALDLSKGNTLSVNLVVETGNLAVTIEDEEGNIFYQNDSAETEEFDLDIIESGIYKIIVEGSHTKGSVSFKRE